MAQVHLVTGAGSGLGRVVAMQLARTQCILALVGRRAAALETTAEQCRSAGAEQCMVIPADIASPESPAQIVEEIVTRTGRLDGLVNNAALARFDSAAGSPTQSVDTMVRTNLIAPEQLIRNFCPLLRASRGSVVNVASIGGLLAVPRRAMYGASKAALIHLTRSLAKELAPEIRINAVCPGAMDTPMYDDLGWSPDEVKELRNEMVATTPLGRMGAPEDVAPWVVALLGPMAGWMTGSIITVDGGRSC